MNCKEFNKLLASPEREQKNITKDMQKHMEECPSCHAAYEQFLKLFQYISEEKSEKISPFITTRVIAKIERRTNRERQMKRVLIPVLSFIFLLLGFFSAQIFISLDTISEESVEIIASEYYLSDNPGTLLEETWLNTYENE